MSYQNINTFSAGKVDNDSSHEYVGKDTLVLAENVDLISQGNDFSVVPSKGNLAITTTIAGKYETFLGSVEYKHKTYRFTVRVDNQVFIEEYDSINNTKTTVYQNLNTVIGFPSYTDTNLFTYVLSADIIDDTFLHWTWGIRGIDGELSGYGEPKRLNISDAKANYSTYSNLSGNYDKPEKLLVTSSIDENITNNKLKYGSYIFYKRHTTKYDERTVLSYPSECINVSEVLGNYVIPNTINIAGFTVEDDIMGVEIFMSNASDNVFKIIKNIDTSVDKTIGAIAFTNSNEYPILDANSSNIINNTFPFTATEQVIADNVLCYAGINDRLKFEDENGLKISKYTPFNYTATGVDYLTSTFLAKTATTAGAITVNQTFTDGLTYKFIIDGWYFDGTNYLSRIYEFSYVHDSAFDYILALDFLFSSKNPNFTITDPSTGDHHFTASNLDDSSGLSTYLTIEGVFSNNSEGLNTDFNYQYGIVFMDGKGRNAGVSNVTTVNYSGDEWTFFIKPNLSSSSITPPYWATKYMFVRDKVNTNLSYSLIGAATASAVKSGYNVHQVETQFYTDYFFDERGKSITVYSKNLKKDVNVIPLTIDDRAKESLTNADSDEYIYVEDNILFEDGSIILYRPNKSVDSKTEVFYETSDIFTITNGVFDGDTVDNLNSYDSNVGFYEKTFSTSTGSKPIVVMKTDKVSLADINHLGRGAYIYQQDVEQKQNATIVHSQPYTPESNYNGLSDFSYIYSNFIDLNRKYGSIEKLFFDETDLLVGQKRKWSKVPINKSLINTASGTSTLQSSSSFFNKPVFTYAGDFGITDKRSFVDYGFQRFFVDQNNGVFGRLSVQGITAINASRDNEINDLLISHYPRNPIIGGYDVEKSEYIVALHGSNRILRFSTKSNQNVGEYKISNIPYKYILLNSKLYSSTQSSDDNLYMENATSGGGAFNGEIVNKKIAFVVNTEPNIVKDYMSTSINGFIPDPEELNGGETLTLDVTIETQKNKTTLNQDDFQIIEGVWYGDYMQDENSDGSSILGVGTVDAINTTKQITLKSPPSNLNVGSNLYQDSNLIGEVESVSGLVVNFTTNMLFTPSANDFIHTIRSSKIEGESIKGNTALVTIEFNDNYNRFFTDDIKIFSVNTNIDLSSNTK